MQLLFAFVKQLCNSVLVSEIVTELAARNTLFFILVYWNQVHFWNGQVSSAFWVISGLAF